MGKERYWAPTSFKRRGVIVETKAKEEEEEEAQTSSGCMCAFFHFFDFHPFNHFSTQHQHQKPPPLNSFASCLPQDLIIPKGVEAPRNSLEILENGDGTTANTMHCNASKDENLKIPIKSIQSIKTSGSGRSGRINANVINDLSPGAKTPTLVARLMGLDLLPDAQSPSSSISSSSSSSASSSSSFSYSCLSTPNPHHLKPQPYIIKTKPRHSTEYSENSGNKITASRSLPETPRISSARRSDVEHHRLSLQINKENMGVGDPELELPRFSFSKWKLDEQSNSNRSPSQYARQIVKQVKERVSRRKVGTDITNSITTSVIKHRESESHDFVAQFRSKKSARTTTTTPSVSKVIVDHEELPSCSPRLRFIDPQNIKPTTTTKDQNSQFSKKALSTQPKPKQEFVQQQLPKCKKAANERFSTPKLKNKQEESFVRSQYSPRPNDVKPQSKRSHPLVSKTVHNLNLLPLNTEPSPPSTTVPQKQVCEWEEPKCSSQLSSGSRQRNKQEATSSCRHGIRESKDVEDKSNGAVGSNATTRADDGPEFQYVTGILSPTMLLVKDTVTCPQFHQWLFPTHPLDPSIFHHLEQHYHHPTTTTTVNSLGLRCHRRLLFDLVDEILLEILGPFMEGKEEYGGSQLAERVWERIGRFPIAKNCEVLEDIDALIEMEEMMGGKRRKKKKVAVMMMEEEEEGKAMMVAEIEGDIVDTLVHEIVMELEWWVRTERTASFEREHGGDMT